MGSTRPQHRSLMLTLSLLALTALGALTLPRLHSAPTARPPHTVGPRATFDQEIRQHAQRLLEEGRQIFRFDTFGDEAFWGDTLQLHQALAQVSPGEALARLLRITVGQQLHRAFEVGEEHRDLLALPFEGGLGGEDFLGQLAGGLAAWGLKLRGWRLFPERSGALPAKGKSGCDSSAAVTPRFLSRIAGAR